MLPLAFQVVGHAVERRDGPASGKQSLRGVITAFLRHIKYKVGHLVLLQILALLPSLPPALLRVLWPWAGDGEHGRGDGGQEATWGLALWLMGSPLRPLVPGY